MNDDKVSDVDAIQLHFIGGDTEGHVVPADAFIQAVKSLQNIVYIIGLEQDGLEVRERARLSQATQQKYAIMLKPPEEGTYTAPFSVGKPYTHAGDLFGSFGDFDNIEEKLVDVLASINRGDAATFESRVHSHTHRRLILQHARGLTEFKHARIELEIERANQIPFFVSDKAARGLKELARPAPSSFTTIFTGRFKGVDFDQRRIDLQHPIFRHTIHCTYSEDYEPLLLEHARELIQVVGNVELDPISGKPLSITDVEDILEIDTSPITLGTLNFDDLVLYPLDEIQFQPELTEDSQRYTISYAPLDIDIVAETRQDLEEALYEEIRFLWIEYGKAEIDDLVGTAIDLKLALVQLFAETLDDE